MIATFRTCIVAFGVFFVGATNAADTWSQVDQITPSLTVTRDYSTLEGNRMYLDNNLGVALMRVPAKDVASIRFEFSLNAPYVYGTYDPANSAGTISVMKMIKMPNGDVLVAQRRFSADDGERFSEHYGMNPFEEFRGGPNGTYVHMTVQAFQAAVGLVMQHYGANSGHIALMNTRTHTWTTKSGGLLRKKITTHMRAYTKPVWVLVTPTGAGYGAPAGYRLPNGQVVTAGMSYTQEGVGTNMPNSEYTSFSRKESKSYWSGLAQLVFAAVASFIVGPEIAMTMMSMSYINNLLVGGEGTLNDATTGFFISGKSDINPGVNTNKWDFHRATYDMVQEDQFDQPGSFGAGFAQNRLEAEDVASGEVLRRDLGDSLDLSQDLVVPLQ